eukprot:4634726-Pyramimonas_sp.AAC.1
MQRGQVITGGAPVIGRTQHVVHVYVCILSASGPCALTRYRCIDHDTDVLPIEGSPHHRLPE